jgi:hypothetical protein
VRAVASLASSWHLVARTNQPLASTLILAGSSRSGAAMPTSFKTPKFHEDAAQSSSRFGGSRMPFGKSNIE